MILTGGAGKSGSGQPIATAFNGVGDAECVIVTDEPMLSLFNGSRVREVSDNVVSLR